MKTTMEIAAIQKKLRRLDSSIKLHQGHAKDDMKPIVNQLRARRKELKAELVAK